MVDWARIRKHPATTPLLFVAGIAVTAVVTIWIEDEAEVREAGIDAQINDQITEVASALIAERCTTKDEFADMSENVAALAAAHETSNGLYAQTNDLVGELLVELAKASGAAIDVGSDRSEDGG